MRQPDVQVFGVPQPLRLRQPAEWGGRATGTRIPERAGEVTMAVGGRRSRFAPTSAGWWPPWEGRHGRPLHRRSHRRGQRAAVPGDAVPEEAAATGPKHDGAALRAVGRGTVVPRAGAWGQVEVCAQWPRLMDEAPPRVGLGITITSTCYPSTRDARSGRSARGSSRRRGRCTPEGGGCRASPSAGASSWPASTTTRWNWRCGTRPGPR
jgi:hypothetical protein